MKIRKGDSELAIWFVVDGNTVTEDITISKSLMGFFSSAFFFSEKGQTWEEGIGSDYI